MNGKCWPVVCSGAESGFRRNTTSRGVNTVNLRSLGVIQAETPGY